MALCQEERSMSSLNLPLRLARPFLKRHGGIRISGQLYVNIILNAGNVCYINPPEFVPELIKEYKLAIQGDVREEGRYVGPDYVMWHSNCIGISGEPYTWHRVTRMELINDMADLGWKLFTVTGGHNYGNMIFIKEY